MNEASTHSAAEFGTVQERPLSFHARGLAAPQTIKIDCAVRQGNLVVVTGWCSDPAADLSLVSGGRAVPARLRRFDRVDVRRSLQQPGAEKLGFGLVCDDAPATPVALHLASARGPFDMKLGFADIPEPGGQGHFAAFLFETLSDFATGSAPWRRRLAMLPIIGHDASALLGHIDTGFVCAHGGGAVSGWEMHGKDTLVWLEDDRGGVHDLGRGYRWHRTDVSAHEFPLESGAGMAGFLCDIASGLPITAVRICGCTPAGRFVLQDHPIDRIAPSSRAAAKALFAINTPRLDFPARARAVDLALLGRVKKHEQATFAATSAQVRALGPQPARPSISVIVPLYGRTDMVEHQLLEFQKDPDFSGEAEIIYVLDDPGIGPGFAALARSLHEICGPSFRWISAGDNRGFSGACNLGASEACGDTLIFLNSDVIPIQPGWAGALAEVIQTRPDVAMVAPRLLFPDGSLQHVGMTPRWRDALGLWTNHHPLLGMDPAFDPADGVTVMPLVTGACVAIRSSDFDDAGRWSSDYLIGDFEDSDLCFTMREAGRAVAYHPGVALIHLERQSVAGAGDDSFRERMTILNATLYNTRWQKTLRDLTR